jgi:hypothetical protein
VGEMMNAKQLDAKHFMAISYLACNLIQNVYRKAVDMFKGLLYPVSVEA